MNLEGLVHLLFLLNAWPSACTASDASALSSAMEGMGRNHLMRRAVTLTSDDQGDMTTKLKPSNSRKAVTQRHLDSNSLDIAAATSSKESRSLEVKNHGDHAVCTDRQVVKERPSIFVIVPGVRKPSRMAGLIKNIQWLQRQEVRASCEVYVSNMTIALPRPELSPCRVIKSLGPWTEFVQNVPEKRWSSHDYVLLWMDDVFPNPRLDLQWLVEIMAHNRLGVASPSYDPSKSSFRTETLMLQAGSGTTGRFVNFLEFRFTLMTPTAFRCLRSMIEPENPRGWGLEHFFHEMCPSHCMGIVDSTTILDTAEACSDGCEDAQQMLQAFEDSRGKPPLPEASGDLAAPDFHRRRYRIPKDWLQG